MLSEAFGDAAALIKRLKKRKISKNDFKPKFREKLCYAIIDIGRLANNADIDLEKQFEIWWKSKDKRTRLDVLKGYSKISKEYDICTSIATKSEEKDFIKMAGNAKGKKVLDVGCGTGRCSLLLARKGGVISGIDISAAMLKIARKKAQQAKKGT